MSGHFVSWRDYWNVSDPPPAPSFKSSAVFFVCFTIYCVEESIRCSICEPSSDCAAFT
ncbi:MAG: hypothetical protein J6Z49_01215 [Kiritimatiellae bacterium]|nr:hypothetical protein [Kiritimatiellia bacterium]